MWSISQCGDTFCTQVNCVFLQGNALKVSFYNSFAFQCYWFFSSKIVPSCHALQWKCTKEAIHDKKRRKEVFCAISKVQKRRSHSDKTVHMNVCVKLCVCVCVCVQSHTLTTIYYISLYGTWIISFLNVTQNVQLAWSKHWALLGQPTNAQKQVPEG